VDGTVRDVKHLIMLRVLSAQSADESAPLAPGDRHRFHVATLPRSQRLASKEPPTLPVRPSAPRPSLVRRPRVLAQGRHVLDVGASQLPDAQGQHEHHRAGHIVGISVLDQLLELISQGCGELGRRSARFGPSAHERTHRLGTVRELVVRSELLEERLLLSGETHAEKVGRGSIGSSGPHGV